MDSSTQDQLPFDTRLAAHVRIAGTKQARDRLPAPATGRQHAAPVPLRPRPEATFKDQTTALVQPKPSTQSAMRSHINTTRQKVWIGRWREDMPLHLFSSYNLDSKSPPVKLSPESLEAFASGDKSRMRTIVHAHVQGCGRHGTTADEACEALDMVANSVAPRLTELEDSGLIVKLCDSNGRRVRRLTRQGCYAGVYVGREFASQPLLPAQTDFPGFLTPREEYPDL